MSSLSFAGHPAFPFSLEESLDPGARYHDSSPEHDVIKVSVMKLQSYFHQHKVMQLKSERKVPRGPFPALQLNS